MKVFLKSVLFSILAVALLATPLFAQKGKPGGGGTTGGSGCATVATPTLSSTTTSPGMNVGIFSRITNCSGKTRYTVTVSAVSSCGEETIIASSVISFNAGESKLISISYPIAPDTCKGVSSVFVNVYSGGNLLASQSTPLTIQ